MCERAGHVFILVRDSEGNFHFCNDILKPQTTTEFIIHYNQFRNQSHSKSPTQAEGGQSKRGMGTSRSRDLRVMINDHSRWSTITPDGQWPLPKINDHSRWPMTTPWSMFTDQSDVQWELSGFVTSGNVLGAVGVENKQHGATRRSRGEWVCRRRGLLWRPSEAWNGNQPESWQRRQLGCWGCWVSWWVMSEVRFCVKKIWERTFGCSNKVKTCQLSLEMSYTSSGMFV